MEKTLKEKTTSALIWSFIDKFGQQAIYMATGVVLGRILSPDDYGLIGTLVFFTALSSILVGSGYGRALMNKAEIRQVEMNTVFFYFTFMGILLYLIFYIGAPLISLFFKQPLLTSLSRILFLSVIFNAIQAIQDFQLTKKMDLSSQAKANFMALIPGSILAIWAAVAGYGVWALVIQTTSMAFFKMILYWYFGKWKPTRTYDIQVLKDLYPFGSRVLLTGLISTVFNNIYYILIGRVYNMTQLGYYTQAGKYQDIPTGLISNTFKSVSVPLLSGVNNDTERLKRVLSKMVRTIAFICFPVLFGMMLIAKPLFIVLITEKWLPSVPIFQLLCISGIFLSLNNVIQESILAMGKSRELLYLEILKKAALVIVILCTIEYGVLGLAAGWAFSGFITLLLSLSLSTRFVHYSVLDLVKDCFPYFTISSILCMAAYFLSMPIANNFFFLGFCILFVGSLYFIACGLFKLDAVMEVFNWIQVKRKNRIIK